MSRAPISAPAPGPNGMMKRTGCCGQACVCVVPGMPTRRELQRERRQGCRASTFLEPHGPPDAENANRSVPAAQRSLPRLLEVGKTDLDGAVGVDLECNRILARLDCNRRHHRA